MTTAQYPALGNGDFMLILTRKVDQSVVFPSCGIVVHVLGVKGRSIKLGFEAPKEVEVLRGELLTEPNSIHRQELACQLDGTSHRNEVDSIHDLGHRLEELQLSVQSYNELKSKGQEEAASKALASLLDNLAMIDTKLGKSASQRFERLQSHG